MADWSIDDNMSFLPSISTPDALPNKRKKYGLAETNDFKTVRDSSTERHRSVMPSRARSGSRNVDEVIATHTKSSAYPISFEPLETPDKHSPVKPKGKPIQPAGASIQQSKNCVRTAQVELEKKYSSNASGITPTMHKSANENGMRQLRAAQSARSTVKTPSTCPKRKQPSRLTKGVSPQKLEDFVVHDENDMPIYSPSRRQTRSASKSKATKEGTSVMPIEVLDDDDDDLAVAMTPVQPKYAFPKLFRPLEIDTYTSTYSYFTRADSLMMLASNTRKPTARLYSDHIDFQLGNSIEDIKLMYIDVVECISGAVNVTNDEYFMHFRAKKVMYFDGEDTYDTDLLTVSDMANIMAMRAIVTEHLWNKFTILSETDPIDTYVEEYYKRRDEYKVSGVTGVTTRRRGRSKGALEPQKIVLVYPFEKDATDVITIYSGDLRVLEDNDFLNDNIIDFQVRELIKKSSKDSSMKLGDHALVANWTKSIDIFSKQIVLVPINSGSHWSLVCLLNIGSETSPEILDGSQDEIESNAAATEPCMLFMDSLGCHSIRKISKIICAYLSKEWAAKRKTERNFIKLPCIDISKNLPRQSNSFDCGVFIIKYIENIVKLFPVATREKIESKFENVFSKTLFTDEDVAAERVSIRERLATLSAEYEHVLQERRKQEKQQNEGVDEASAEVIDNAYVRLSTNEHASSDNNVPSLSRSRSWSLDTEDDCIQITDTTTNANSCSLPRTDAVDEYSSTDVDSIGEFEETVNSVRRECAEEKTAGSPQAPSPLLTDDVAIASSQETTRTNYFPCAQYDTQHAPNIADDHDIVSVKLQSDASEEADKKHDSSVDIQYGTDHIDLVNEEIVDHESREMAMEDAWECVSPKDASSSQDLETRQHNKRKNSEVHNIKDDVARRSAFGSQYAGKDGRLKRMSMLFGDTHTVAK